MRLAEGSGFDSVVFNGGFENTELSDASGFGWQVTKDLSGFAVYLDDSTPNSGSRDLRLHFSGSTAQGDLVSQRVLVQPGIKYRLTFVQRSPELLSGGLPAVTVETDKGVLRSSDLKGTGNSWKLVTLDFTASSRAVKIALQRSSCKQSPCPIFGELYLDDFGIKPL